MANYMEEGDINEYKKKTRTKRPKLVYGAGILSAKFQLLVPSGRVTNDDYLVGHFLFD